MANYFWVGGTGTWTSANTANIATSSGGVGGAGPVTATDNLTFDSLSNATAYTVTVTTGTCANLTIGAPLAGAVTWAGTTGWSVHGSLSVAASSVTWTNSAALTFSATTTGFTITTNGVTLTSAVTFSGAGGGWTLGSALTSTGAITLTNGALSLGGFNMSFASFNGSNSNTRSLTFTGSETMTVTGTGAVWQLGTITGMTFTPASGTIKLTDASATGKTFAGGGLTYNKLWFSGGGTGINTINQSNTFATLQMDGTLGVKTLRLTSGTTQTITSASGFQINGDGSHQTIFNAVTSGTPATLSIASGTVNLRNVSLQDSTATGGATFNAFTSNGNVNTSNNTGWNFAPPPSGGGETQYARRALSRRQFSAGT